MSPPHRLAAPATERRATRWHRLVAVGTVMAAAAMTLTGCLTYDVGLTVGADDTVSGTVVLSRNVVKSPPTGGPATSAPPSIPIPGGISSSAGTDAVGLAKPTVDVPTISVTDYRNGDEVGYKCTFDKTTFADAAKFRILARRGGALQFSRSGRTVAFNSELNLKYPTGSKAQAALVQKNFNGQVTINFPGKVLQSNGKFNGSTVTWTLTALKDNVLTAKIRYDKEPDAAGTNQLTRKVLGIPVWILGAGALVLIILVAGLFALIRARKKDRALQSSSKSAGGADRTAGPPANGSNRSDSGARPTESTGPAWPAPSAASTGSAAGQSGPTVTADAPGNEDRTIGAERTAESSSATREYSILPPPPPPRTTQPTTQPSAPPAVPPGQVGPAPQRPAAAPSAQFVAAPPPPQFIPISPQADPEPTAQRPSGPLLSPEQLSPEQPSPEQPSPEYTAPQQQAFGSPSAGQASPTRPGLVGPPAADQTGSEVHPDAPSPAGPDSEPTGPNRRAGGWPPPEPLWQDSRP